MTELDPFSEAARFGVNWNLSGYQVSELAAAFKRVAADSAAASHLVAAAPDLLEALQEVMQWIGGWDPSFTQDDEWPSTADKARYAIAKADGFVVSEEPA